MQLGEACFILICFLGAVCAILALLGPLLAAVLVGNAVVYITGWTVLGGLAAILVFVVTLRGQNKNKLGFAMIVGHCD